MRSQNIKVNNVKSFSSVGKAGCLGLLALGLALVNPVMGSVYANGGSIGVGDTGSSGTGDTSKVSSVTFSFGTPVGVADLTPVSSNGASAKYSVKATVSVENSGGYVVYLGSNKSELVGKNTGTTINAVTGSSTYEGLPLNSWGYNAVEGETAGDSFQAIPTNNRGDIIGENTSNNIKSDEKTFTLSFATRIGNDKPADTYENQVRMSVVSSPLEITNAFGIETMQDMTSEVCDEVEVGTTDRLRDVRDDKMYWVRKMPDNQCWMVQNLALDLGTEWPDASLSDYDLPGGTRPTATASSVTSSTMSETTAATGSWRFGDLVINNPETASNCGSGKSSLSACSTQFTDVSGKTASNDSDFYINNGKKTVVGDTYDAHYLAGNYYQWNTATAGSGGTMGAGETSKSICPKNWRLPQSNTTAVGSFQGLVNAGDIGTDVAKFTGNGYFFVRGGGIYSVSGGVDGAGDFGRYWSSTAYANTYNPNNMSYDLRFTSSNQLRTDDSYHRYHGYSVRCVAR